MELDKYFKICININMLKEVFIGHVPSHFQVNTIVKAFIISETFLWSAWNFVTPIIAIFVANDISGGNVEVAAMAFSTYLVVRVIFELISGRYLLKANELMKFFISIFGLLLMSAAYIGFSMTTNILSLFLFYGIMGAGLGMASPAKNSLFSTHLDKNKEPIEWGMYDAAVFMGMALSTALGGFIAKIYGFQILFVLSAIINFLGIIPYVLYIHQDKSKSA
ncbi:MAG: MFS transporter [Actinobacteria bacterium]|nr:MFS transporter [Actinomycetota bacterium]